VAVRATQPLVAPCGETADAPVLVLNFSGSAVADSERIREAARRLVDARSSGHRVVGVLSAPDDTTAELAGLATSISEQPQPREYDMLVSAGARIAAALCAMAVHDLGYAAISLSGSQAGIVTDNAHGAATIVEVRPRRVQEALAQGCIVLVADAQGMSMEREITTFGPGCSNATAAALAAALAGSWQGVNDRKPVHAVAPSTQSLRRVES
jgi:aspartate kinase